MIRLDDIFLLNNRFMILNKGGYNLHNARLNGVWMEMLPPLLPFVEITANLQVFEATEDEPSEAQTYTVSANNLYSNIGITAPQGYEISLDGTEYIPSISLKPVNGVITSRTVYVRLINNSAGTYNGMIKHRTTGFSEDLAVEGVVSSGITAIKYGLLYNWYATQEQGTGVWLVGDDMRSEGWGVATKTDFNTLITHLGGTSEAGAKLRESGTTYWKYNTGTNNVNFNGRGSGNRNDSGFVFLTESLVLLTQDDDAGSITLVQTGALFAKITVSTLPDLKETGISIRPVRPATTAEQLLPDGEIDATYTGNDGKVYRCTKIGTQVWIADNLAETKWSDGSWIQGYDGGTYTPITNANWAALTTAALCAYDNDESNVLI